MNKKLFITFFTTVTLYFIAPLLIIKYTKAENLSKAGLIIMLLFIFSSFAINLLFAYFVEIKIYIPIFTTLAALPTIFIFNKSAFVLIIISLVFSFFGYFIGKLIK